MPKQNPLAMKSGDIIRDHCSSCDKSWVEHPGIQLLCTEARQLKEEIVKLKQDLSDAQLTIKAMDGRMKDLMEKKERKKGKGET